MCNIFTVCFVACTALGLAVSAEEPQTQPQQEPVVQPLTTITVDEVRQQVLRGHNEKRALYGSPPLKLNDTLNEYAQRFAEALARTNRFYADAPYGENVYWSTLKNATGNDAIEKWYSQSRNYNWGVEEYHENIAAFTQMIWKASTDLGVGLAQNSTRGYTYIVASYSPMGNVAGQYKENVPRAGGSGGVKSRVKRHLMKL